MENIRKEYDAIVDDLAERARLIRSERKDLELVECVKQAIDDGLIYSDDEAVIVAWSYENGLFGWGEDIDWVAVENNLIVDIIDEIGEDNE
jgi:hypothetical protein